MEDKDPVELELKAGRRYKLCTCGYSKNLPFCDNEHRKVNEEEGTSYKSLKIWPSEDMKIKVYSTNWRKEK